MAGFPDADLAAIIAAHPNKATGTLEGAVTVAGIYTAPSKNVLMLDGSINATAPLFVTRTSDVAANGIDIGTSITIGATTYQVIDTDPRNDGMTGLILGS